MKEKCCIVCRMILGAVMGLMLVIVPCFVIILLVDSCWSHRLLTMLDSDTSRGMFCRTLGAMAAMHLISGSEVMSEIVRMGIFRQMK